jgi:hypothetical protein
VAGTRTSCAVLAATLLVMATIGGLASCVAPSGQTPKPTGTPPFGEARPLPGGVVTAAPPVQSPTATAGGPSVAGCATSAADAVIGYLAALDQSRYSAAQAFLDHPKAMVWPAVGIVESLASSPVPADVVHIADVRIAYNGTFGPETLCVCRARISPGKEAARLGVTEQGERALALWAVKRGNCWKLMRGGPVSDDIAAMLVSGFIPFRNIAADIPAQASRGQKFSISFEIDLHPALGKAKDAQIIEGIALLFQPEPDLPAYPKSDEQVFSIPNLSKKWPKHVQIGESQTVEGVVVGEPEVPSDLQPGEYRLYLGLEDEPSLYWPVQPYVVDIR